MRTEKNNVGGQDYWVVYVAADEIPKLRYAASIGTVHKDGKIALWRPAAGGIPRDYKVHAMAHLNAARANLQAAGHVKGGR
jgi:hypothetical protein